MCAYKSVSVLYYLLVVITLSPIYSHHRIGYRMKVLFYIFITWLVYN